MNPRWGFTALWRLFALAAWSVGAGAGLAGQSIPATFAPPERIVVVGDVHGDHGQLVKILRMAAVIDGRDRWVAGKDHLVQLGDLPDRGPDTLKAIRLLQSLERQAQRRGGRVHVLIGNHDAMNVYGDLRYVVPGEYDAFVTRDSARLQEAHYLDGVDWIKANVPEKDWPVFDDNHRKDWYARYPRGYVEHRRAWMPGGEIGKWIGQLNAAVKIGDTLFVHAGLGPSHAESTLEAINDAVRTALADVAKAETSILREEEGPLWYRGLATNPEATEAPHLEALLQRHGVRRIVVGHTPTPGVILTRFNGAVVLADVGLSAYYGSGLASLIIEGGQAYALHRGTRLALPVSTPQEKIAYLEKAAALEPDPTRLVRLIGKLRAAPEAGSPPPVQGAAGTDSG